MKFAALASGSKGNATFVRSGDTRILVDNGLSLRELTKRLAAIGERPEEIDAYVVTHAHGDHCSGIAAAVKDGIRRGRAVPVWCTEGTAKGIDWQGIGLPPVKYFDAGKSFAVDDIKVSTFTVMHDCTDPVGMVLEAGGTRLGIATDLGFIHDNLRRKFRGCGLILMESNHDLNMLANGDYSLELKQRIGGRTGHLSNAAVAEFIRNDMSDSVSTFVIGHLSNANNNPETARLSALEAITSRGLKAALLVALQGKVTEANA